MGNVSGQDSYIKNRLNVKAGYLKYSDTEFRFISPSNTSSDFHVKNEVGHLRFTVNYKFNNVIEAGTYIGYSPYKTYIFSRFDSLTGTPLYSVAYSKSKSIMYGVNSNIHILPFFIKKDKFRFDVYCSIQLGGIHLFEPTGGINTKSNYFEYGVFGGLAFYPFKHLGVFTEYGYGKYSKFKCGLSYNF